MSVLLEDEAAAKLHGAGGVRLRGDGAEAAAGSRRHCRCGEAGVIERVEYLKAELRVHAFRKMKVLQ